MKSLWIKPERETLKAYFQRFLPFITKEMHNIEAVLTQQIILFSVFILLISSCIFWWLLPFMGGSYIIETHKYLLFYHFIEPSVVRRESIAAYSYLYLKEETVSAKKFATTQVVAQTFSWSFCRNHINSIQYLAGFYRKTPLRFKIGDSRGLE